MRPSLDNEIIDTAEKIRSQSGEMKKQYERDLENLYFIEKVLSDHRVQKIAEELKIEHATR